MDQMVRVDDRRADIPAGEGGTVTIQNPTPWRVTDSYIYDANGDLVDIWHHVPLIVDAVNAYVAAETQLTVLDGELGDRWRTQEFDRHQCAQVDGEIFTISQWLDRIGAVEVQIARGNDGYVVWAKERR